MPYLYRRHLLVIAFMYGFSYENCKALDNLFMVSDPSIAGTVLGMSIRSLQPSHDNDNAINGVISGCQVSGNKVIGSTNSASVVEGITIDGPENGHLNTYNIVVKNNVVQDNNGCANNSGIHLDTEGNENFLHNIIVDGNTIEAQHNGIFLSASTNCIFQNNTITDVDYGVFLDGTSSCNSINNNYVTNAGVGFTDLQNPSSNLFSRNTAFDCTTAYNVTYKSNRLSSKVCTRTTQA